MRRRVAENVAVYAGAICLTVAVWWLMLEATLALVRAL